MKKVQQLIYKFATETGSNISETDNLIVCLNGEKSAIRLIDLFETYKQGRDYVKGHSILANYNIDKSKILIPLEDKNIRISLINKNTDEEIFFSRYSTPIIQLGDKTIDEEKYFVLIRNEYNRLFATADNTELEIEEEINVGKGIEELEELTKLETEIEEEKIQKEDKIKTDGYDKELEYLLENGYKEHALENHRLLYNENEKKMVLLEVEENKYNKADYDFIKNGDVVEITLSSGTVLIFDYNNLKKQTK